MKRLVVTNKEGERLSTLLVVGGTIEGMHFSGLDRLKGVKQTRRASDVEFDYHNQAWVAFIRPEFRHGDGPHHFMSESRDACISWERKYLDDRGIAIQTGGCSAGTA